MQDDDARILAAGLPNLPVKFGVVSDVVESGVGAVQLGPGQVFGVEPMYDGILLEAAVPFRLLGPKSYFGLPAHSGKNAGRMLTDFGPRRRQWRKPIQFHVS